MHAPRHETTLRRHLVTTAISIALGALFLAAALVLRVLLGRRVAARPSKANALVLFDLMWVIASLCLLAALFVSMTRP